MRMHLKDKPIFRSLLVSNLIIFLVPFLFSLIGYPYFSSTIQDEILRTHDAALRQIKSNLDHDLHLIENANSALINNHFLEQLSRVHLLDSNDRVDLVSIQKELRSFCNGIPPVEDMGIYFPGSGGIISTNRYYDQSILHVYTSLFSMDPEQFISNIQTNSLDGLRTVRLSSGTYLLFLRNLFDFGSRKVLATVFSIVPWNNIVKIDGIPDQSSFSWYQEKDDILLSSSSTGQGLPDPAHLPSSGELVFTKADRVQYVSSSIHSDMQKVLYILTVPSSLYFSRMQFLHIMTAVQILTVLAVGAFLVFKYTFRNYRPLERMAHLLGNGNKTDALSPNYETIENELKTLLNDRETLIELQEEKEENLKNSVLSNFMRGQSTDYSLLEHFWGDSLSILNREYRVIAFTTISPENSLYFKGLSTEDSAQAFSLLLIALRKHLQQHLPGSTLYVTIDSMLVAITEWREADEKTNDQNLRSCVLFFREKLGLDIFAAVSASHHSPGNLHHSYYELSEAMAYHSFWEDMQPVLYYEGNLIHSDDILNIPGDAIYQFRNLLNAQEYEKARDLLNEILDLSLKRDIPAMDYNRCNMSALAAVIIGSLHYSYQDDPLETAQIRPLIKELAQTESLPRFREIVYAIFDHLAQYHQDQLQADMPGWLNQIKEYIETHYADSSLNVSQIADHFDLSVSHLGRTYKKYFGSSLLESIHYVRIQNCKTMLSNGYSVKEAAEKSGYIDSKSMIRAFKKFEGITPGQYKNTNT